MRQQLHELGAGIIVERNAGRNMLGFRLARF